MLRKRNGRYWQRQLESLYSELYRRHGEKRGTLSVYTEPERNLVDNGDVIDAGKPEVKGRDVKVGSCFNWWGCRWLVGPVYRRKLATATGTVVGNKKWDRKREPLVKNQIVWTDVGQQSVQCSVCDVIYDQDQGKRRSARRSSPARGGVVRRQALEALPRDVTELTFFCVKSYVQPCFTLSYNFVVLYWYYCFDYCVLLYYDWLIWLTSTKN